MRVAPLIAQLFGICNVPFSFCRSLTVSVPALVAGVILLFISQTGYGQCTIVCRNSLNISLSTTGDAVITPDFLLQDPDCDPNDFTVDITDPSGTSIGNILNCTHVNLTMTATVTNIYTGNFCSTTLQVGDYLAPWLTCTDLTVFCSVSTAPQILGYPSVQDNCTTIDSTSLNYSDTFIDLACYTTHNGDSITSKIERTWTAVDASGNQSSCLQTIYLKRATVEDVVFPLHRDGFAVPALDCQDDPTDLSLTGEPSVDGYSLDIAGNCELYVEYEDQTVPVCGSASYRILRKWTIIDYCSGDYKYHIQVIKLEDTTSPQISCPANSTVSVDYDACTATVNLPIAMATDDCSNVTITPSWIYGSGYGPFTNIPLGTHLVTYTAEDDCGNTSSCQMSVTVIDDTAPTAVCDQFTQINLASNGQATIPAITFDDGSFDNCAVDSILVSRDGINYAQIVHFDCNDIATSPIMVHLKVIDVAGNYNECTVEATIVDNYRPVLICPSDTTLLCHQDYSDLTRTGEPSVIESCTLDTLYYSDQVNLNACNIGTIYRTWTAIDASNNKSVCTQTIVLEDTTPVEITFPENIDSYSCGNATAPSVTGQPIYMNDDCESMYQTYSDQVFNFASPACYKIFRTWEVIDWCVYDPNSGTNDGFWTSTQVISVFDTIAPVITCPADTTIANIEADCGAVLVTLTAAIATDCSPSITITNDSPFASSSGADASGNYPIGTHLITYTVMDGCSNSSTCTTTISVVDAKPPTAKCISGVVINLSTDGTVTLNPTTIDNSSTDNCTDAADLQLAVSPAIFTCDDLGEQTVELIVTDEAGNSATCITTVTIQDNQGHCPYADVGGVIMTESGNPVKNVIVTLSGAATDSVRTNELGEYRLKDVAIGEDYVLTPAKDTNILNGISTFDLLMISQHILGLRPLGSPYKMIAADANNSGSITTFDIVMLRKLLLFISNSLPRNASWRFVDADFTFENPTNPFTSTFPEVIVLEQLTEPNENLNFIAVKVGDVNGSANAQQLGAGSTGRNEGAADLLINAADVNMKAGETYDFQFTASQIQQLRGFQFTMNFDARQLEFLELVDDIQEEQVMGEANFGWTKLAEGSITASWMIDYQNEALKEGRQLFKMRFQAKQNCRLSDVLFINSQYTKSEAYRELSRAEYAFSKVQLSFARPAIEQELIVYQNYPNPFSHTTTIEVESSSKLESNFTIFDAQGRAIYSTNWSMKKGSNQLRLDRANLGLAAGTYIYQIRSENGGSSSKKMLVVP